MRLVVFFANVVQSLRRRVVRPLIRVVSPSSLPPSTMPDLISTFLIGSPDPELYSLTDGVVRQDRNIDLGDAIKLGAQDALWENRGKAIQAYAMLEQALSSLLAELSGMQ